MLNSKKIPVVLVVETVYKKAKETFESASGIEVVVAPVEEELLSEMVKEKDAFAVVIDVHQYKGPLYESMKKGGLIARFGVGCDGVDFRKAKQHQLFVTNTPDVLESTVAEFTVFLAGEVLRKSGIANGQIKQGKWSPQMGNDLNGKVWAIIGLGRIGKKLSTILAFGFGVHVLALKTKSVDPIKIRKECGTENVFTDFFEIAPLADIVSLHLPANKDTYHFMDMARLKQLKPGAILINTGRGALIDESALYEMLENGHLSGAGLDVFENEPYVPVNPEKDLRKLKNVVLTSHIASSTVECAGRMAKRVIRNIRFGIEGNYEQMDRVVG